MRWLVSALLCGSFCMAQPAEFPVRQSLRDLRKRPSAAVAVQKDLEVLERGLASNAMPLWSDIEQLLSSHSVSIAVRVRVLEILTKGADTRIAEQLAVLGRQWVRQIVSDAGRAPDESRLLSLLLGSARSAPLADGWAQSREALRLYADVVRGEPSRADRALGLFAASQVPQRAKQETALELVESRPAITEIEPVVLANLGPEQRARLVEVMRKPSSSPHFAACAALAHFGEEGILADLRQFYQTLASTGKTSEAGYFQLYAWQVEIQRSPESLEDFVAHAPAGDPRWRWALSRAVERGVDKERLRTAVHTYVGSLPVKQVYNPRTKATVAIRMGAELAKVEGLRVGVLRQTDLPNIPIPATPDE
jgi:hypothetical protein